MSGHDGHGDATLDVIALLEATLKDDEQGYDALFCGVLASDHLPHVLGTLLGVLADELASHHGKDGALQELAEQRGHELGSTHCNHDHDHDSPPAEDHDPPGRIEDALLLLAEVSGQNGTELAALTRAVERLGDIIDKRLA